MYLREHTHAPAAAAVARSAAGSIAMYDHQGAILDPSELERPLILRRRSPERSACDDCNGGQDHRRRYCTTAGATTRESCVAAAGHLTTNQLASLDRVRLVAVGVDGRADVAVLAQQHRQLVSQWFLCAGHIYLLVRPEDTWVVHLEVIRTRQGTLTATAQWLKRASASGFLKTLEVRLPIVAD